MKKLNVVLVVVLLSILISVSTGCMFSSSLIGEWGYLDGETIEFFENRKVLVANEQGEYLISDGNKLTLIENGWGGSSITTFEYEVKRNTLYLKADNIVIELERLSSRSGSDSTPIIVAAIVIILVLGALLVGVIAVIAGIAIYKKKAAKNS